MIIFQKGKILDIPYLSWDKDKFSSSWKPIQTYIKQDNTHTP